jgi:hypothetical protein
MRTRFFLTYHDFFDVPNGFLTYHGFLTVTSSSRIISRDRCSWMAVYVFCCNAQSKSHSDLLDISRLSLFYQLPNCNLFTQHVLFIYGERPLVNCGSWSYFHHIAITCLLYSYCLLYSHTISFSTRYAHNLCFKQTGEIDNLIVIWEQSICLCVCRFRITFSRLSLLSWSILNLGFFNWGKTSCYTHHTFLLVFPTGWLFTTHKDSLLHINLAPAANFLGAINQ